MVNAEHYPDPTADIAIARADRELERKRRRKRWKHDRRRGIRVLQLNSVEKKKTGSSEAGQK